MGFNSGFKGLIPSLTIARTFSAWLLNKNGWHWYEYVNTLTIQDGCWQRALCINRHALRHQNRRWRPKEGWFCKYLYQCCQTFKLPTYICLWQMSYYQPLYFEILFFTRFSTIETQRRLMWVSRWWRNKSDTFQKKRCRVRKWSKAASMLTVLPIGLHVKDGHQGSTSGGTDFEKPMGQNSRLTLRRLMSYIYGAPILDVSRSHTTTQHSR